ncbi:hypothetical protein CF87_gp35 [Sulfolobus monocaudavirus SMV1]|uniref:hypothetical protein n=1 Tax=Sulfolobus monocaudavirus SMV1 TaxID=1351702 RepID=UPI0003D8E645|nr:hypothetical protein CF87_gp35 [Sulfolobus monocaudavirus SMV1]CDF81362.1 hypothetical protein [Sulfolobus monocaudavirus SMV1]
MGYVPTRCNDLKEFTGNKIYVKRFENGKLCCVLEIANERYNRWNDITLKMYDGEGRLLGTWCDDSRYLYINTFDDLKKRPAWKLWEDFVWQTPGWGDDE